MSYGLIDYNTLKDISDSIRFKTGSNRNYYPRDMARAINQIKTGDGGFDEPTVLQFSNNLWPYPSFNSGGLQDIEFLNILPVNNDDGNYELIYDDCSIQGLSPDKVSLYYFNSKSGNSRHAFYVDGNKWSVDQFSILDMSSMFKYAYNMKSAFCGKYTVNMHETYEGCDNITIPVCGDYVTDFSNAYVSCDNITNAICGINVKNMAFTYQGCGNLRTAVIGPSVENIAYAYAGCQNLSGDVVLTDSVKCISNAFEYCNNLNSIRGSTSGVVDASRGFGRLDMNNVFIDWNNFSWDNVINASDLFNNVKSITDIEGFASLRNAASMFYNANNLQNVKIYSTEINNASNMFAKCVNLTEDSRNNILNVLSNNVETADNLFYLCANIHDAHITNKLVAKNNSNHYTYSNMYSGVPLENVTWDEGIGSLGMVLTGSGITNVVWPDSVSDAYCTYQGCYNLANSACGPLVTNMYHTYYNCDKLLTAVCGNNVTTMHGTYDGCANLVDAVCGPNVINMYSTYYSCTNLINAACGPNVVNMISTYWSCTNLMRAVIGDNVNNIGQAYQYCYNLTGDIEINSLGLYNLRGAFERDNNLQNILIRSESIPAGNTNLQNAFYRNNYSLRRNIVLTNIKSYANFVSRYYNAFGPSITLSQENYAEPVPVNVNGVNYDTVRCNYSAYYNVYVYCTE
jgi:hypothetical protein